MYLKMMADPGNLLKVEEAEAINSCKLVNRGDAHAADEEEEEDAPAEARAAEANPAIVPADDPATDAK